jgi:hypothetical protein
MAVFLGSEIGDPKDGSNPKTKYGNRKEGKLSQQAQDSVVLPGECPRVDWNQQKTEEAVQKSADPINQSTPR